MSQGPNEDYGQPGHGLGRRQTPIVIPDDIAPGMAPHPSEGVEGPPISEALPPGYLEMREQIDELGRRLLLETRPDFISAVALGNTDASGNAVIPLYQVANGMEARLHRLVLGAYNPTTNARYTPAVPYSNSAAYIELHGADSWETAADALNAQTVLDFGPPTAGGPIFPALLTDMSMQAAFIHGPQWFVLLVNTGPASTLVTARYQIRLDRQKGIA